MSARVLPETYRLARDIQPGWDVQASDGEWVRVTGWFRYDHPTRPSWVKLRFADGSEGRLWATDEVMTRKPKAGGVSGTGDQQ